MLSNITCTACDTVYSLDEVGCDICIPAKRVLAVRDDGESDLTASMEQSLRLLRMNQDRLEHSLKHLKHKEYFAEYGREASVLSRAMATLGGEVRKHRKQEGKRISELTALERVELLLTAFEKLTRDAQERLFHQIVHRLEANNAAPAEVFEGDSDE